MAPSDRELLERSARGERAAFDEFVERHSANVHRYSSWLASDPNDAEELLQQTFVAAWRAAGEARVDGGARNWLLAIARRNASKLLARRGATREREQSLDQMSELSRDTDGELSLDTDGELSLDPNSELSLDELGELAGFGDTRHTPERMAHAAEERSLLEQALAALAPQEREILVLRELEGLDGAAVAKLLDLSLAAQKSRLHRARLRLAAELRQRMRTEDDR